MADRDAPPPGHVLSGYWDVLEIRARDFRSAARCAGRERGLWLSSWRFHEDPECEVPTLVWLPGARVPLLEVLRVYTPEIRAAAARYGVTRLRVYGTAVTGDESPDPVVELLVDLEDGGEGARLAAFGAAISDVVGRPVDVEATALLRPDVLAAALRDAVDPL